jgi:hypothetical protein
MTPTEWHQLTTALELPYTAHREARLHVQRGGPCWRKPAGGHPPALTLEEKLLITVLRVRFGTPQHVLAELFGVVTGTISNAQRQVKPLLDRGKHTITPAHTRLKTLTELTTYAATHGITLTPGTKAAC